jgi:hypothetical protein
VLTRLALEGAELLQSALEQRRASCTALCSSTCADTPDATNRAAKALAVCTRRGAWSTLLPCTLTAQAALPRYTTWTPTAENLSVEASRRLLLYCDKRSGEMMRGSDSDDDLPVRFDHGYRFLLH